MTKKMKFANRVRALRKEHKLTQKQLGEMVGITESNVRKWEAGVSFPCVDALIELTIVFNKSSDFILGLCENEPTLQDRELSDYNSDELMKELIGRWTN